VDTLHTVLNRGCSMWDRDGVPASEFAKRLERIRSGMKEHSLDLLLVYGDSWKFGNLAFVSHFMPKNRGALTVIPVDGPPALVVQEPDRNNPFSSSLTWLEEVHSTGQFAIGLARVLASRRITPKRVGLVSVREQLGIRQWNSLFKDVEHAERVDSTAWFESLRREKTATELKLIHTAADFLKGSVASLRSEAGAGRKEYEIMASAERAARGRGAEDFRLLLANADEPQVGLRPASDTVLQSGDTLLVVVAGSYQRYWAELGQTLSVGTPSRAAAKGHELASGLFKALQQALRTNVDSGSLEAVARKCLPAGAAADSALSYGLGNGLGLDLVEAPLLGVGEQPTLVEGMVLTLRACVHAADCGSGLIARPFEVTPGGVRPLVELSTDVLVTGG
jgi:Xaa-Pro aminopeptidase